jgi:hypothetical protein
MWRQATKIFPFGAELSCKNRSECLNAKEYGANTVYQTQLPNVEYFIKTILQLSRNSFWFSKF